MGYTGWKIDGEVFGRTRAPGLRLSDYNIITITTFSIVTMMWVAPYMMAKNTGVLCSLTNVVLL